MKKLLILFLIPLLPSCNTVTDKQPSHCQLTDGILAAEEVNCGTLSVPENHLEPNGRKIEISFILLKAKNNNAKKHPVIYFTGGPGGPTLTKGRLRNWAQHPFLDERDLIVFDQRGIGYSSAIPNIEPELMRLMQEDLTYEEELDQTITIVSEYRQKCEQLGIGLAYYNTFQNAEDVGKLMDHLGYAKYNLQGGSYGTRLARVVQDKFPEKINAVILNSPAPLSGDFLVDRLKNYEKALTRVFDYCENSPDCKEDFPNLKEDYLRAIKKLGNNPIKVGLEEKDFYINVQDGLYLLRRMLYRNDSRTKIPELIRAYNMGEGGILEEIVTYEMQFSGGFNASMMMAVERHEQYDPTYTALAIEEYFSSSELLPAPLGYFTSLYLASKDWHNNALPEDQKKFKLSDVPTVIMVNQYDPVTPPENGALFKESLSNSTLFVLDEGGHGGGNAACRSKVLMAFMDNPTQTIDASCLNLYMKD